MVDLCGVPGMVGRFARVALPWVLFLVVAGPAVAAMYKWTDAEGNVHYSQTPPPEGEAEELAPPPPPALSPEEAKKALERSRRSLYPEEKADQGAGQEAPSGPQVKGRKEVCEAARHNLEVLKQGRRIRDADGNVKELAPEEHEARMAQARQRIERFCKEE